MATSSNTQKQMEMEEGVKLLTAWNSGFGMRVELALKAKGIEFQTVHEDLSNKSELLLTSNPVFKKVPVLIHNGRAICESRIILEYIDETWPTAPRLLPNDPYDRYLVRFWSEFLDNKVINWHKSMLTLTIMVNFIFVSTSINE
jgi:glutathione S-transferase